MLSMPVPSSYNDVTEERWLRDFIGWVWYDKQFYVPPSWLANNKRVVLRFDSVFYRCKVVSLQSSPLSIIPVSQGRDRVTFDHTHGGVSQKFDLSPNSWI